MPDEARHSNSFLVAALIISIPAIFLTVRGVWICGWPEADMKRPEGPTRRIFAVDEMRWREKKTGNTHDSALWNEHGQAVLGYPPEEREALQKELIQEGLLPESLRLRPLSPAEQSEMQKDVAFARARNEAIDYSQVWVLFGIPLNLLAPFLTFLAFWRAYGRRDHRCQMIISISLFVMNMLSLLLTARNAAGTSFD